MERPFVAHQGSKCRRRNQVPNLVPAIRRHHRRKQLRMSTRLPRRRAYRMAASYLQHRPASAGASHRLHRISRDTVEVRRRLPGVRGRTCAQPREAREPAGADVSLAELTGEEGPRVRTRRTPRPPGPWTQSNCARRRRAHSPCRKNSLSSTPAIARPSAWAAWAGRLTPTPSGTSARRCAPSCRS